MNVWILTLKIYIFKEKHRFRKDLRISFPKVLVEIAYFSIIEGPPYYIGALRAKGPNKGPWSPARSARRGVRGAEPPENKAIQPDQFFGFSISH